MRHPVRDELAALHAVGGPLRHEAARRAARHRRRAQGPQERQHRQEAHRPLRGRHGDPRGVPHLRRGHRLPRLPPARHGRHRQDGARVLRQQRARRRGAHGGGQVHPQRAPQQGAHDAVGEAVRVHAVIRRQRRGAEPHHEQVPAEHLLRDRDLG